MAVSAGFAILVLFLLVSLMFKHFICDFPLQKAYMYKNKGTYLHPGGLLHAGIHGVGTALAVFLIMPPLGALFALKMGLLDSLIHYHVDWAKVKIGAKYDLKPDNSEWFWILLGLDQFLHFLTYAYITLSVLIAMIHQIQLAALMGGFQ
jgi:hypothetical protein